MIRVRSLSELTYPKPTLTVATTISIVSREESPVEARREINNDPPKNKVGRPKKSETLRRKEYTERLSVEEKRISKAATAAYMREYRARQKVGTSHDVTVKINQFTCNVPQQTDNTIAGAVSSPVHVDGTERLRKRKKKVIKRETLDTIDQRLKGKIIKEIRMRDRRAKNRTALRDERQTNKLKIETAGSLDDQPLEKKLRREAKVEEEEDKVMSSDDEPLEKRLKRMHCKEKEKLNRDSLSDPVQNVPEISCPRSSVPFSFDRFAKLSEEYDQ
ncbi:uncharacterized protein [Venturia canescens]|uniref:uncharacterized protein n=1 Tax=Venturia canescens TaxID=32260 RepID=UPI001C9C0389|nr:uncharacterized protein LOC122416063 [Venturia canescens]